jgi:dihydropteroate synthase
MTQQQDIAEGYLTAHRVADNPLTWKTSRRTLHFGKRPLIMGILNVTPDSFYDGGEYYKPRDAILKAEEMVEEGADIIDVGGESTRPSSTPVDKDEEIRRILPVVRGIASRVDIPVSIDTYKADVARIALEEGAEIVNDISGLNFDTRMTETVAQYGAGLVLMHIKGNPQTMQEKQEYEDLLSEVRDYLGNSLKVAEQGGIKRDNTVVDPGIGFGKSLLENYTLIRSVPFFRRLGRPVLVGPSRKSFLWKVLKCTPEDGLGGSISAAIFSFLFGADLLRVHDVGEVREALIIAQHFVNAGNGNGE